MFHSFDSASVDYFIEAVKTDPILRCRIKEKRQLDLLRVLGHILLESEIASPEAGDLFEALCDEEETEAFFTDVLRNVKNLRSFECPAATERSTNVTIKRPP